MKYDTLAGFDLTANKETIAIGETITFRFENVTDTEQTSGVKSYYTIHRKTLAGWRDIFYRAPDSEQVPLYHAVGISQPPSEGFTWEVMFTQSGLAHEIKDGEGALAVCTPLRPGTYRFVFMGVSPKQENESDSETEYALGARFSVSDD